jgi:hypothetical protein
MGGAVTASVGNGVMGGAVITSVGAGDVGAGDVGSGVSGGSVAMGGAVSGGRVNPGVGASVLFVPASTTTVVDVARSRRSSDAREEKMLECIIISCKNLNWALRVVSSDEIYRTA